MTTEELVKWYAAELVIVRKWSLIIAEKKK